MLLLLPMFGLWWTKVGGGQAFCVERGLRTCPVARPIYHISRVPLQMDGGFSGDPNCLVLLADVGPACFQLRVAVVPTSPELWAQVLITAFERRMQMSFLKTHSTWFLHLRSVIINVI